MGPRAFRVKYLRTYLIEEWMGPRPVQVNVPAYPFDRKVDMHANPFDRRMDEPHNRVNIPAYPCDIKVNGSQSLSG
jgi:hypothetical protein